MEYLLWEGVIYSDYLMMKQWYKYYCVVMKGTGEDVGKCVCDLWGSCSWDSTPNIQLRGTCRSNSLVGGVIRRLGEEGKL